MKTKVIITTLFILYVFLSLTDARCIGQTVCKPIAKPFMYLPPNIGNDEIKNFKEKQILISKKLGVNQDNTVILPNFWGMMEYLKGTFKTAKYLHIYIGVCDKTTFIPKNFKKKLILIFAPASNKQISNDLGYFILPSQFNPDSLTKYQIADSVCGQWMQNFVDVMPLSTLIKSDTDNLFHDMNFPGRNITSDTRYITFCINDFFKLGCVAKYYASINYPISNNLKATFAAFSSAGIQRGQSTERGRFKKRILILFDLLDSSNNEYNLNQIDSFRILTEYDKSECDDFNKYLPGSVDNGQLCPTNCGR